VKHHSPKRRLAMVMDYMLDVASHSSCNELGCKAQIFVIFKHPSYQLPSSMAFVFLNSSLKPEHDQPLFSPATF
jgi:hypothetical protein